MRTIDPSYICQQCLDVHDDKYDAEHCCRPDVDEVYICPECNEQHSREAEALDCCPREEEDQFYVSKADLEAAGQLRLQI